MHNIMVQLNHHQRNKIYAFRALEELAMIATPQAQFYFLRGLDPFVFEEMILTALKRQGHGIIRNAAYTGDGGADGCVFMGGARYLIQAKRYKKHINAADVESFAVMCKRRKAKGLFVHTGRTGRKSKQLSYHYDIDIVSGAKLLGLLTSLPETITREHVIDLSAIAKDHFGACYWRLPPVFNRCA